MTTVIPKRVRYEVLRRDNYTCRYCGAKAPDVKLNVDAVVPEALGGSHKDPANLVTACESCNNGKSSSSPDAPLVAAVSETALQWAAAMKAAQARMLADIEARQANHGQFREWWNSWGYGEGEQRRNIPMDAGWEQTVDQFVSAGLPMPALKECVDRAMARKKVADEHTFRYMCGIAWSKITDLQKAASSIASGDPAMAPPKADIADRYEQGRLDLARELLDELSDEERAYYLDAADARPWQDEDDEPQTEAQMACEAVGYALNSARSNFDWLSTRLKETLSALPAEMGEPCIAQWDADLTIRDPVSRIACRASAALYLLDDLAHLPADTAYLDALPADERAEWITFAKALLPRAKLSDERWLVRAADCARNVKAGRYYTDMCTASGEHIPDCPILGTHYVQIDGLTCCKKGNSEHKGHLFCEAHLEQLVDGTFVGRSGRTFTAVDFTEVKQPQDVWTA